KTVSRKDLRDRYLNKLMVRNINKIKIITGLKKMQGISSTGFYIMDNKINKTLNFYKTKRL
ncbi:MAG: hypothetical protein J6S49_00565, partial [Erysipelotrichaceae bacterium]|nr:hypothetical protein [Erysipelotrichaceae bacterium]